MPICITKEMVEKRLGRKISEKEIPTFKVKRINDFQVAFKCPKCGKENIHGSPKDHHCDGHRVAHCDCYPKGYFIVEDEEKVTFT